MLEKAAGSFVLFVCLFIETESYYVAWVGSELSILLSASQVLGFQVCTPHLTLKATAKIKARTLVPIKTTPLPPEDGYKPSPPHPPIAVSNAVSLPRDT